DARADDAAHDDQGGLEEADPSHEAGTAVCQGGCLPARRAGRYFDAGALASETFWFAVFRSMQPLVSVYEYVPSSSRQYSPWKGQYSWSSLTATEYRYFLMIARRPPAWSCSSRHSSSLVVVSNLMRSPLPSKVRSSSRSCSSLALAIRPAFWISAVRCFLSESWRCLARSVLFRLGWLFSESSSFSSSMMESL